MKLSCFSAVIPVIGWNQCVKCVAPFSTAQSFIALATTFAISRATGLPSLTDFLSALKVSFGRRCFIVKSLKTIVPNISSTFIITTTPFQKDFLLNADILSQLAVNVNI